MSRGAIRSETSSYIIRSRGFHLFSIGWGNGIWAVNLAARNIFNKGRESETWVKQSALYSEYRRVYAPGAYASLKLSVTYTLGYGKKVRRGDEAGAQEGVPSAIIR